MADFFSQFQVHPPAGFDPNTGIAPRQDFNLGGFQPAPGQMPLDSGFGVNDIKPPSGQNPYGGGNAWSDPRLSPLPQPWQQGPISGPAINGGNAQLPPTDFPNLGGGTPIETLPQFKNVDWSKIGWGHSPDVIEPPPGGYPNQNQPLPDWMQKKPGLPTAGGSLGSTMPSLGPAAQMGPNGPIYTNGQGQATDQFGNPIGTSNQTGQVNLSPLANGIGQPMNPSQQSGMVLMRSPDGLHMQNVPQAHVDHYTGLGATQVTGPQLTGSSYGGSI